MKQEDQSVLTTPRPGSSSETPYEETNGPREVVVCRAGSLRFAVFAEEAEVPAEELRPAPLPGAPAAVLGVVSLRGRIRTVLDPLELLAREGLSEHKSQGPPEPGGSMEEPAVAVPVILPLRGDEQIALAAESVEGAAEVTVSTAPTGEGHPPFVLGSFATSDAGDRYGPVLLLDPAKLFEAAVQGMERRRQRLVK